MNFFGKTGENLPHFCIQPLAGLRHAIRLKARTLLDIAFGRLAMGYPHVWWRQPSIRTTESILGHIAAVIVGFVLMVVGLGLGVTMVLLPVGIVIGLIGVAMFVGGLFARIDQKP